MNPTVALARLAETYAVCRLPASAPLPAWAGIEAPAELVAVSRTRDELSLVVAQAQVPADVPCERGWSALKVLGPLPFEAVGILAGLSGALAAQGISLFVVSTYDTDYILVREDQAPRAVEALVRAGYAVRS